MRTRALLLVLVVSLAAVSAGCVDTIAGGVGDHWALELTQVDGLHERGLTGAGVTVAVIDTGIDLGHPEFKDKTIRWADLVNNRKDPYDDHGHGTHVAGIIAAQGDWTTLFSGFYLKGVAPDVSLIAIKAIAKDGKGVESNVARGINIAVDNGADVIVLSLGGARGLILGTETERAVNAAIDRGVFVVAAAGNEDQDGDGCDVTSPASVPRVIAVGAIDSAKRIADFSCTGQDNDGRLVPPSSGRSDPNRKPEVVAPGVGILSAWKEGKYVQADGTSQAAPYVGGIIALILQDHPDMQRKSSQTVVDVKSALMTSSAKIGPLSGKGSTAHDDAYGYGLVQAEAALRLVR